MPGEELEGPATENVLLVLQHDPDDPPAELMPFLRSMRRRFQVVHYRLWLQRDRALLPRRTTERVCFAEEQPMPAGAAGSRSGGRIVGIVSDGSTFSVNDESTYPYLADVMELFRDAVAKGKPTLAVCGGAQLLSKALGGVVTPNATPELGWVDIALLPVDSTSAALGARGVRDWFAGCLEASAGRLRFFQFHSETFSVPPGGVLLATSLACRNQAFQVGDLPILGVQFHPEVDRAKVENWVREGHPGFDLRDSSGNHIPGVTSPDGILASLDDELSRSSRAARCLFENWAKCLETS